MKWTINKNSETKVIDSLARELNISTVLSSMLVKRGVTTFEQAKEFFRPNFEKLHDPFLMKDMIEATSRIKTAIEKKEKIMIFGDYDVDGTCSVALLSMFLQSAAGLSVIEYIPDRVIEGYGISFNAIDFAKSSEIKLIIALDCGIKAFKQVEYAKENNIEFIICDHHSPDDKIPNATAILNPKRNDCSYPYKDLCGCGVGFKLIQAINTSLVALGFSSSASSTDNSGIGFDVGFGLQIDTNFSIEGSYVNYGTLEIKTNTTGPTENITTEITGDGVAGALKYGQEGYYVKAGMHSWDFSGKVTASLGSSSDSLGTGTDPFFGIGFGSEQMELGYEYYKIDDGDISSLSIRLAHKF